MYHVSIEFSIILLAFYHECRYLIGYATHCPFKQKSVSVEELSADSCPAEIYASFKNIKFPRGNYQTDSSET